MEYLVPEEMPLPEALKKMYPESSRRTLQTWLKNGRFVLDEKQIFSEKISLKKGQKLLSQKTFKAPRTSELKILYEDRHFIVIDKPVGLLSVPLDEGARKRDALTLLRKVFGSDQIFAVHRIDKDTSGVLLFARGKSSAIYFDKLFEAHEIKREYAAIVEGKVKEDKGTWKSRLLELPNYTVIESDEGKEAITHFEVLQRSEKYSHLKLRLETGKKHQIRVQCQIQGHPVVGDHRYGSTRNPIRRLCLHACTLGFKHPSTKKDVEFFSFFPELVKILPF